MSKKRLQSAAIRVASVLVPSDERADWLEWWRSELWYVPHRDATRFCFGAIRDAFWVRRNRLCSGKPTKLLRSPFSCLTVLGTLSAVSLWISNHLERLLLFRVTPGTSAVAGISNFLFFYVVLIGVAFIIRDSPGN